MRIWSAFVLGVAAMAPAAAQEANPVLAHYRAYNAAIERQDVAAAEAAAEQALAASEARDGDGGHTAVLALNLATVRIVQGDNAGALGPARRAFALANAGAAGVDPNFAELILGRTELATTGRVGADRLARLLAGDNPVSAPAHEVHSAAVALGRWGLTNCQPVVARSGWSAAAASASGSPFGEAHGFGVARTGEAAAIVIDEIGCGRTRGRIDAVAAREASQLLAEAYLALRPLAEIEAPNLELTVSQRAYAETLAWRSIIHAKLRSNRQPLPRVAPEAEGDADGMSELGPADLAAPRCLVQLSARPAPEFPRAELSAHQLGAVVVRLRLDETGAVTDHEVVAQAGRDEFAGAVDRVASQWSVARRDDSPLNCRMPRSLLAPVTFIIR